LPLNCSKADEEQMTAFLRCGVCGGLLATITKADGSLLKKADCICYHGGFRDDDDEDVITPPPVVVSAATPAVAGAVAVAERVGANGQKPKDLPTLSKELPTVSKDLPTLSNPPACLFDQASQLVSVTPDLSDAKTINVCFADAQAGRVIMNAFAAASADNLPNSNYGPDRASQPSEGKISTVEKNGVEKSDGKKATVQPTDAKEAPKPKPKRALSLVKQSENGMALTNFVYLHPDTYQIFEAKSPSVFLSFFSKRTAVYVGQRDDRIPIGSVGMNLKQRASLGYESNSKFGEMFAECERYDGWDKGEGRAAYEMWIALDWVPWFQTPKIIFKHNELVHISPSLSTF
jgi:hypothetical protein